MAAAQQQCQPEPGKTIQKDKAHAAGKPRAQNGHFNIPKPPPRPRAQCPCRLKPCRRHLNKPLICRPDQHRKVKKHIAVQQQIRRILPAAPQQAVRPEQGQHAHARHQRGHHERQHQQAQHESPPRKLKSRQHPRDRYTQGKHQDTGCRRLKYRPCQTFEHISIRQHRAPCKTIIRRHRPQRRKHHRGQKKQGRQRNQSDNRPTPHIHPFSHFKT